MSRTVHEEPTRPASEAAPPAAGAEDPLPDLLSLDLADLRTVRHPVLGEVLEELRERARQPSEVLWGFNSAL
ncbi:FxSxx-COOH cyclophane-containing RiPP peptide [Streptomyces sp. NPDC008313]|uniref:FxSxx-COOH cyclophane-containing RiPP peptide n=1 Tax=Streptomyces sp. NPDC008313 TaxID=3364826 RepID=UPI0036E924AE